MGQTLLGGGSPLNKFKAIDAHLSRNSRTVYVERSGDDIKGDGTAGRPFASVERAFKEATGTTDLLAITLGDGEHHWDSERMHVFNVVVSIGGTGRLVVSGSLFGKAIRVEYGYLFINCAGVTSTAVVDEVIALGPHAFCYIAAPFECSNAKHVAGFHFDSSVLMLGSEITNNDATPIPLWVAHNGSTPIVQKVSATLTRITE